MMVLNKSQFAKNLVGSPMVYALVIKETIETPKAPSTVQPLLDKFSNIMLEEFPNGLSSMRDI